MTVLIVIALAWVFLIFAGGAGLLGRSGTQRMIDRWKSRPRAHAFLSRWHGEIRAGMHYVEFGGLSLILYALLRLHWSEGLWSWEAVLVTIPVCTLIAYLDEKRQELTPGRQFRMIDFKHSIRGLVAMQVIIALVALARWGLAAG